MKASDAVEKRTSTDRRVVRTKKAIREAVLQLVEQQDYQKITISSISRLADIDRKTFYLHYRSVDDVAEEILREEAEDIVAQYRSSLLGDEMRVDAEQLYSTLRSTLNSDFGVMKRIIGHVSLDVMMEKLEQLLTEAFLESDSLGLGRRDPYLEFHVTFFTSGLMSVYKRWLDDDGGVSLDELARTTSIALTQGTNGVLRSLDEA